MKIRIWQLLALVSVAALVVNYFNEASYSSIEVKVSGVLQLPDSSFPLLSTMKGDYCLLVDFPTAKPKASAFCSASFGRSGILGFSVTESNCEELKGESVKFRYRARDFLWFKRRSVSDTIEESFSTVRWSSRPKSWGPAE